MSFTSVVESEPVQKNEKVEGLEQFDSSQEESEDARDIKEAYDCHLRRFLN